jgi:hypothetical protein
LDAALASNSGAAWQAEYLFRWAKRIGRDIAPTCGLKLIPIRKETANRKEDWFDPP